MRDATLQGEWQPRDSAKCRAKGWQLQHPAVRPGWVARARDASRRDDCTVAVFCLPPRKYQKNKQKDVKYNKTIILVTLNLCAHAAENLAQCLPRDVLDATLFVAVAN